jgi:hypothetical protein
MNKTPFLKNMSKYQCALLDIMWNIDTMEELESWISTLDPQDQLMAQYLATRLRDSVDTHVDFEITDVSQAKALLEKF